MIGYDMKISTIKVTVDVLFRLKKDFGHLGWTPLVIEEIVPTGSSIMDLLRTLASKYSVFGMKAFAVQHKVTFDYCGVVWHGTFLTSLTELDAKLKDGDTIKLIPNIYGG